MDLTLEQSMNMFLIDLFTKVKIWNHMQDAIAMFCWNQSWIRQIYEKAHHTVTDWKKHTTPETEKLTTSRLNKAASKLTVVAINN